MITPTVWKAPFQVNTTDGGTAQFQGKVIGASDGSYYAVWYDNFNNDIKGRHFDTGGNPVTGEVQLATASGSPDLALLPNQHIAIAFDFTGGGGGGDTYVFDY